MTAERKYTDRDVRENITLRAIAENYVVDYGGDFEPLVNAVKMMEEGERLPTNVIRVVLNCMRNDYTVAESLPNPTRPRLEVVRNVTKKKSPPYMMQCDLEFSHEGHTWSEEPIDGVNKYLHYCNGVAFEINRGRVVMVAHIKTPYVIARSGKLIHSTTGVGECEWYMPRHEYGWPDNWNNPKLSVQTICRFPSVIRHGILLTKEQVALQRMYPNTIRPLNMCPHCKDAQGE